MDRRCVFLDEELEKMESIRIYKPKKPWHMWRRAQQYTRTINDRVWKSSGDTQITDKKHNSKTSSLARREKNSERT